MQDLVDGRDDHLGRSVDRLRHRAGWVAELAGDLRRGQAGQHLGVVLRPGQDELIPDVEEGDRPGLIHAVDVGRHVVAGDETGVQLGLRLQRVANVVGQLGGAQRQLRAAVACRAERQRGGVRVDVSGRGPGDAKLAPRTEVR